MDIIYIGISLLAIAMAILIVFKISNEFNAKIQASSEVESYGKEAMGTINSMYPGVVDNSMMFLAVGLCIVALALAAMIRVHPIFLVFFIIMWFIIAFLCGIFSNIYLTMANDAAMADIAEQLTFTTRIMAILPIFLAVFGGILAVIMYRGWQNQ